MSPTWNDSDFNAAIDKANRGEKLTGHERTKLKEAGQQAGGRGTSATKALEKDDKR